MIGGWRLGVVDVEAGGGQVAVSDRLDEGVGLDDVAARHVDEDRAGLHAGDGRRVDQALVSGVDGQWSVTASLSARSVSRGTDARAEAGEFGLGDEGIMREDAALERR